MEISKIGLKINGTMLGLCYSAGDCSRNGLNEVWNYAIKKHGNPKENKNELINICFNILQRWNNSLE